jgi:hypothetical protein
MTFVIYLLWYYVVDQFGQSSLTTHLEWSFPAQIMAAVSLCLFISMGQHLQHFAYSFTSLCRHPPYFLFNCMPFPRPSLKETSLKLICSFYAWRVWKCEINRICAPSGPTKGVYAVTKSIVITTLIVSVSGYNLYNKLGSIRTGSLCHHRPWAGTL